MIKPTRKLTKVTVHCRQVAFLKKEIYLTHAEIAALKSDNLESDVNNGLKAILDEVLEYEDMKHHFFDSIIIEK